ncbi:MAG TPA: class I SAM-dependent methyltransferase [Vicinamibacterales bacterium]|nr:class I SAM-dependent methyltransferase [Vicinamibacterales bacterium]
MPTDVNSGESAWAERAAARYDDEYARRYRRRDDELEQLQSNRDLVSWLGAVCDRFSHPIDVLDLGCGTGRYFWGLRHVSSLVGLDASAAMLDQARHPLHSERLQGVTVTLVRGDLLTHSFPAASFDLVYSIGVLAEHVPLDRALVNRVHSWLRPGGRFAFTTVHPQSASVPRTPPRVLAGAALGVLPRMLTRALHRRFVAGGLYGDERWIAATLEPRFEIESLERFQSDVHLHARCLARKS